MTMDKKEKKMMKYGTKIGQPRVLTVISRFLPGEIFKACEKKKKKWCAAPIFFSLGNFCPA